MESGDHFKNGASPKSHTNRKNFSLAQMFSTVYKILIIIVITVFISDVAHAQTVQERQQQVEQARLQAEQARQQAKQAREQAAQAREQAAQVREQAAQVREQALETRAQSAPEEYKTEVNKEFSVGSSPMLTVSNEFGNIRIIEGGAGKIAFNIKITGQGTTQAEAKKNAESVDINLMQTGNSVMSKTTLGRMACNNCGRKIEFEVTVPKNTKLTLENKYGDIYLDNVAEPLEVKLEFGKLYANALSKVSLDSKYGGATINTCSDLELKSSFSKYKLGEVETVTASASYDEIKMDVLGNMDLKAGFTQVDIGKLNKSFQAKDFSYGSLKIRGIDENFSKIKVNASFTPIDIAFTKNHNFKVSLYTSNGNIDTGNIVFYEKSLDKKDAVAGIAGKLKEPSATVEITNSYGNIALE
jgi:hypothetical protein